MSDAELHLAAEQAAGRHIFVARCMNCHEAYRDRNRNGPSLKGMFAKPYLPSGAPANEERTRAVIERGRGSMPHFGDVLTDQQMQELLAYLHTL